MNNSIVIYSIVVILLILLFSHTYKKSEFFQKIKNTDWTKIDVYKWIDKLNDQSLSVQINPPKRVCVVCYDDRKNVEYIEQLKQINQTYCNKHGYDFKFYDSYEKDESKYPPYWLKIKIVLDILKSDKYDYVMWIDSDACFYNISISIENIFSTFGENIAFVMSSDREDIVLLNRAIFNAGVWIVNNNKLGIEFMEEWLKKYNEKEWSFVKGKWICNQCFYDFCKQCIWAGKSYEQGSCDSLLTNKKYENSILFLDSAILQGIDLHSFTFVLHFYGDKKSEIKYLLN